MTSLSVLLDFDGTITTRDLGDVIVHKFGLPNEPETYERFQRGELSLRELWTIESQRLQKSELTAMTEFARNEGKIRPGLPEFVSYCDDRKIPIEVASSGIKFYIQAVLEHSGLGSLPIASPSMEFDQRGLGLLTFEEGISDCSMTAMCKCERVWRQRRLGRSVLFVGDGASDTCAASQADHLIARDALASFCDSQNLSYVPFEDFHDVRAHVERTLLAG